MGHHIQPENSAGDNMVKLGYNISRQEKSIKLRKADCSRKGGKSNMRWINSTKEATTFSLQHLSKAFKDWIFWTSLVHKLEVSVTCQKMADFDYVFLWEKEHECWKQFHLINMGPMYLISKRQGKAPFLSFIRIDTMSLLLPCITQPVIPNNCKT